MGGGLFLLLKGKCFGLKENQLCTNHLQRYVCVQKYTLKMKTTMCWTECILQKELLILELKFPNVKKFIFH